MRPRPKSSTKLALPSLDASLTQSIEQAFKRLGDGAKPDLSLRVDTDDEVEDVNDAMMNHREVPIPDSRADVYTWGLWVIDLFAGRPVWGSAENGPQALGEYLRWRRAVVLQKDRMRTEFSHHKLPPDMPSELVDILERWLWPLARSPHSFRCVAANPSERFTDLVSVIPLLRKMFFESEGLPHLRATPFPHHIAEAASLSAQVAQVARRSLTGPAGAVQAAGGSLRRGVPAVCDFAKVESAIGGRSFGQLTACRTSTHSRFSMQAWLFSRLATFRMLSLSMLCRSCTTSPPRRCIPKSCAILAGSTSPAVTVRLWPAATTSTRHRRACSCRGGRGV